MNANPVGEFISTLIQYPQARKEAMGVVRRITAIVWIGLALFAALCVGVIISYYWK